MNPQDLVKSLPLTATHDVNYEPWLAGSFDPQHHVNISQGHNSNACLPYQSWETDAQLENCEGLFLTPNSALLQTKSTVSVSSKLQPCFPTSPVPTVPIISSAPPLDLINRDSSGSPKAMRKKRPHISQRCPQCSKEFSQNHKYKYVRSIQKKACLCPEWSMPTTRSS